MNSYDSSNNEMVLYSYSIGFIYILAIEIFSGQIFDAISFSSKVKKFHIIKFNINIFFNSSTRWKHMVTYLYIQSLAILVLMLF